MIYRRGLMSGINDPVPQNTRSYCFYIQPLHLSHGHRISLFHYQFVADITLSLRIKQKNKIDI